MKENLLEEIDITSREIMSLDFILLYLRRNFPRFTIKTVTPYSFTIGSNNNEEGLENNVAFTKSLFFGQLHLCINPNTNPLANELIRIKYKSYLNSKPYFKTITRIIEIENLINESTVSNELFDELTITQASDKYDFYFTFIGFKIDYN